MKKISFLFIPLFLACILSCKNFLWPVNDEVGAVTISGTKCIPGQQAKSAGKKSMLLKIPAQKERILPVEIKIRCTFLMKAVFLKQKECL